MMPARRAARTMRRAAGRLDPRRTVSEEPLSEIQQRFAMTADHWLPLAVKRCASFAARHELA